MFLVMLSGIYLTLMVATESAARAAEGAIARSARSAGARRLTTPILLFLDTHLSPHGHEIKLTEVDGGVFLDPPPL